MSAVALDTSVLLLILQPSAPPPTDPATNAPLMHAAERINYLVKTLSQTRSTVLVPTPVLAEVLTNAGAAGPQFVLQLQRAPFKIAHFDTRAAIECAAGVAYHLARQKKSRGKAAQQGVPGARAKMKFDQQVVAIAQVNGASVIYSDDDDVYAEGRRVGIAVTRSFELPRDPSTAQTKLPF